MKLILDADESTYVPQLAFYAAKERQKALLGRFTNKSGPHLQLALVGAALSGDIGTVQMLIERGAKINYQTGREAPSDSRGLTALGA